MKQLNIIIIDDNQTYREILSRSLTRLDCCVEHFSEPNQAIDSIRNKSQLIVLLDLKLDSDSGLRWIKSIREANKNCQIILVTGYASISTAVEAIKLGADDYLAKPITAREILKHLKNDSDIDIEINAKPMSVERLEWEHIQKVMNDNDGNISATARALSMHRRTLQRKLAKKPVQN